MITQLINNQGNAIKNQFVITENNIIKFQSYNSLICTIDKDNKKIILSDLWNYSQTTSKHLYKFLKDIVNIDVKKKDIEKAINEYSISGYELILK